jgi:hypothetical protein
MASVHQSCHAGPPWRMRSLIAFISETSVTPSSNSASPEHEMTSLAFRAQLCHRNAYGGNIRPALYPTVEDPDFNARDIFFDGCITALNDKHARLASFTEARDAQSAGFISDKSALFRRVNVMKKEKSTAICLHEKYCERMGGRRRQSSSSSRRWWTEARG